MIDVKEHFYSDDPRSGPPDVRTRLKNASYFFLGNGLIQAAVQLAPSGEGTPVGLLLMDPQVLAPKREALSMDADTGLEATQVSLAAAGGRVTPDPRALRAGWLKDSAVPSVWVEWSVTPFHVEERFFCPSRQSPVLIRAVRIRNTGGSGVAARFETGIRSMRVSREIRLSPGEEARVVVEYTISGRPAEAVLRLVERAEPELPLEAYWKNLTSASFGLEPLDRLFQAAKAQLPAVISRSGRVDGSVWQYNREWVRDQSVLAASLSMLGERDLAQTMLERLLTDFVTPDGDTVDSSERRSVDEVELDQNGFLLMALDTYARWAGDLDILRRHWPKIVVTAEFPLRDVFRHSASGLLVNGREFWERHGAHGIEKGMELAHQLYISLGLKAAAAMGRRIGREEHSVRWETEAARLKRSMLEDKSYGLVDKGRLIKRRGADGSVQDELTPLPRASLPASSPLMKDGVHRLNPDSSAALAVATGFVPGRSRLARATLESLQVLWNQGWTMGGYGRYHLTSEPDSPGPWPFASLFVARAMVEMGDLEQAFRILRWMDSVPGAAAGSWFEFYGERESPPFPQVGIIPWTWAELVVLLVHHVLGVRPDHDGLTLRPRRLPGLRRVQASLPVRGSRLDLEIVKERSRVFWDVQSNASVVSQDGDSVRLAWPKGHVKVRISIP